MKDFTDKVSPEDKDLVHLGGFRLAGAHIGVAALGMFIIAACAVIVTLVGFICHTFSISYSIAIPVSLPIASYLVGRFAIALVKK